jgi:hypothetical protein
MTRLAAVSTHILSKASVASIQLPRAPATPERKQEPTAEQELAESLATLDAVIADSNGGVKERLEKARKGLTSQRVQLLLTPPKAGKDERDEKENEPPKEKKSKTLISTSDGAVLNRPEWRKMFVDKEREAAEKEEKKQQKKLEREEKKQQAAATKLKADEEKKRKKLQREDKQRDKKKQKTDRSKKQTRAAAPAVDAEADGFSSGSVAGMWSFSSAVLSSSPISLPVMLSPFSIPPLPT